MNSNLISYIENGFLSPLIKNSNITDISYNGKDLFYQDNLKGRNKSEISVSPKEAYDFVRQISNLSDSLFSYSNPILDVSCGRYRINATHYAISRKDREKAINFSIRIGFEKLRIINDGSFIPTKVLDLVKVFIQKKESIVISGVTGSGKTELQKFLISLFRPNTRILIIDNVDELETDYFLENIDSQTWLLNNGINLDFDGLIKNALRVNPDWIIVSEARGGEMLSLLNSAMTGHPTISTIHSKDIEFDYSRMTRMCMIKNPNLKYDETIIDVFDHFKLLIHVKKEICVDGTIKRYVEKVATNIDNKTYVLYSYPNKYSLLPYQLKIELGLSDDEFGVLKEGFKND